MSFEWIIEHWVRQILNVSDIVNIKSRDGGGQTFALYGKALQLPVPVPAPSSWALVLMREQKMRNIRAATMVVRSALVRTTREQELCLAFIDNTDLGPPISTQHSLEMDWSIKINLQIIGIFNC